MDERPAQSPCEVRGPFSVAVVVTVILPAAVVEDGKQLHDLLVRPGVLGQAVAVFADAGPVADAVDATQVEREPLLRGLEDEPDVGQVGTWSGHGRTGNLSRFG